MKQSNLSPDKTIDSFNFEFQNSISKRQIKQLLDFEWLEQAFNLVFLGPPGVGKTHLANAIGLEAINTGYKVIFISMDQLIKTLKTQEVIKKSQQLLKKLKKADLVIIDELGYLPISKQEANQFFQLVNDFYEQTSIIITSNNRALADGLGMQPAHKKIDMFKQIQQAIFSYHNSKNITPVIIIDEAQFLKNSILDDLRLIFNFEMDSKDFAIVILSGQIPFISQLNRQTHEALRQRIVVNYCLKGITRSETKDYILSRLKLAGSSEPIFSDNAFELIFSSTNGFLRKVNTLARMSLIEGANQKVKTINSDIVFQVLNEIDISA